MRTYCLLSALMLALLAPVPAASAAPAKLTVAAAADLQTVLPKLVAAYGSPVQLSFGSSGKLYTQLVDGAPFDAFFSADESYPKQLEARHLTLAGTRASYAVGRLVLWTAKGSGVDVSTGYKALDDARVAHVAIANPTHAPYGRAAAEALHHAGAYDRVKPKLVQGENVAQTAQFAASGSAQLAFISFSLVGTPALAGGHSWEVPSRDYAPIVQSAVGLASTRQPAAVKAFLAFVHGPKGQAILVKDGFKLP